MSGDIKTYSSITTDQPVPAITFSSIIKEDFKPTRKHREVVCPGDLNGDLVPAERAAF